MKSDNSLDYHFSQDEYFIRQALLEAENAYNEGEVPIGAVIVANNQIIARAYNQVERLNDPTAHAEILAITSACNKLNSKYLNNCKLYVSVEPCPMCAGAIRWARLKEVHYCLKEPKFGFSIYNEQIIPKSCRVIKSELEDTALELMSNFFQSKR